MKKTIYILVVLLVIFLVWVFWQYKKLQDFKITFAGLSFDSVSLNKVSGSVSFWFENKSVIDFVILRSDLNLYVRNVKVLELSDDTPRLIERYNRSLLAFDFETEPNELPTFRNLFAFATNYIISRPDRYRIAGNLTIQKNNKVDVVPVDEII